MIILSLVAIAFLYKAMDTQNLMMAVVVLFLILLIISRYFIIKLLSQDDKKSINRESDFIYRYFNEDPIHFCDMKEVYRRGNCEILYEEKDGIMLLDHTSKIYYASAKSNEAARDILSKLPQDYGSFVAHEEVFETYENQDFSYHSCSKAYNYLYTKKEKYRIPENLFTFKILDINEYEKVKENYSLIEEIEAEYLLDRIKEGMMAAYLQDELVGFIGMHNDGAIGMLEVFKGYEGRHIATYLQCTYINYLLDSKYPGLLYTQVIEDNEVSMHIQKKLQFEKASKSLRWYQKNKSNQK